MNARFFAALQYRRRGFYLRVMGAAQSLTTHISEGYRRVAATADIDEGMSTQVEGHGSDSASQKLGESGTREAHQNLIVTVAQL